MRAWMECWPDSDSFLNGVRFNSAGNLEAERGAVGNGESLEVEARFGPAARFQHDSLLVVAEQPHVRDFGLDLDARRSAQAVMDHHSRGEVVVFAQETRQRRSGEERPRDEDG